MNDDVKAAVERVREWEFYGPDNIDRDILLAHIDGEAARTAAAVAAAREEQREVIHDRLNTLGSAGTRSPADLGIILRIVGETPLTATPLGDRIAELEKTPRPVGWTVCADTENYVEGSDPCEGVHYARLEAERRAEKAETERDAVVMLLSAKLNWTVASELMAGNAKRAAEAIVERLNATENERDDAAIASKRWQASCVEALRERDALRAQVSELEEYKQEGDDVEVAAQRLRFWAENPYACPVHFGARTACGQCYDSERALRRSTEAQVEAARAECMRPHSEDCTSDGCAPGCVTPDSILAAMDGAKP